jgi:hypothetical protein
VILRQMMMMMTIEVVVIGNEGGHLDRGEDGMIGHPNRGVIAEEIATEAAGNEIIRVGLIQIQKASYGWQKDARATELLLPGCPSYNVSAPPRARYFYGTSPCSRYTSRRAQYIWVYVLSRVIFCRHLGIDLCICCSTRSRAGSHAWRRRNR